MAPDGSGKRVEGYEMQDVSAATGCIICAHTVSVYCRVFVIHFADHVRLAEKNKITHVK